MSKEEYLRDQQQQQELEERARRFVDKNESMMDTPTPFEPQSSAQNQHDNDTLDTLQQLRETSLYSGDRIDA